MGLNARLLCFLVCPFLSFFSFLLSYFLSLFLFLLFLSFFLFFSVFLFCSTFRVPGSENRSVSLQGHSRNESDVYNCLNGPKQVQCREKLGSPRGRAYEVSVQSRGLEHSCYFWLLGKETTKNRAYCSSAEICGGNVSRAGGESRVSDRCTVGSGLARPKPA